MKSSKVNVLIIDSGVYRHKAFENDLINVVSDSNTSLLDTQDPVDGHGTAVYGIIRKSADIATIY